MIDATSSLSDKLRYLKAAAYYSVRSLDHEIGRWIETDCPEVQANECKLCGAYFAVDVRYDPVISGVLGEASKTKCSGK